MFERGPQRPTLVLLCRDPGPEHSCHVRNNNEPNSRVASGLTVLWSKKGQKRATSERF